MTNILITSGGKRVDLIKEFKSVLGNRGQVIITDFDLHNAGKFFADRFYLAPKISDKRYILFLKDVIAKHDIKLLFSVIDPELPLLSKNKQALETTGCKVLISTMRSVRIAHDKAKTAAFFQKIGVKTPHIIPFGGNIKFPAFVKPRQGSGSKFAYKVNSKKELEVYKGIVPKPLLFEYISGQEYTIDALNDFEGNIINVIPRKRIEVANGVSIKAEVDMDPAIIEDCFKILRNMKIFGPSTIQCIKSPSGNYFIELNLRFGGGAMLGIKSGGNYAAKILGLMQGKKYPLEIRRVKNGYRMAAYIDHKFEQHD